MLDISVQSKILENLYESWKEDFAHPLLLQNLNMDGISQEAMIANANYLASKGLITKPEFTQFWTRITVFGIDWIEDKRFSPDVSVRKKILEVLEQSYVKDAYKYVRSGNIVQLTNLPMREIERNVWYLENRNLIEAKWTLGGLGGARITSRGIDILKEPTALEKELKIMSNAYSILYLLENQLRVFIERKLREKQGEQWVQCIPPDIMKYAEQKRNEDNNRLSISCYLLFKHFGQIIGGKTGNILRRILITQEVLLID